MSRTRFDYRAHAREITAKLRETFGGDTLANANRQALTLAEEVGEFVGAFRRWSGQARRTGSYEDMAAELADVAIAAYVAAEVLEIDLERAMDDKLRVIFERGWREAGAS